MEQPNIFVLHVASDDAPYVQVLQVKALGKLWPVDYKEGTNDWSNQESFYHVHIDGCSFIADDIEELQQVIDDFGMN